MHTFSQSILIIKLVKVNLYSMVPKIQKGQSSYSKTPLRQRPLLNLQVTLAPGSSMRSGEGGGPRRRTSYSLPTNAAASAAVAVATVALILASSTSSVSAAFPGDEAGDGDVIYADDGGGWGISLNVL